MKALDDLEKLLGAMRDRGAEMQAFEGLLTEISGSLADIVAHLEKPQAAPVDTAAIVKAMTDGLGKLKAPTINVQPAPVQVNVPAGAAPVVNVLPANWTSLVIKVGKSKFDGNKEFTITKT